MHVIAELLLRTVADVLGVLSTVVGAVAGGVLPTQAVAALLVVAAAGIAGVAIAAVLIARAVTLLLRATRLQAVTPRSDRPDVRTRIAWSHPDAAGHVRPRGPGGVPAT
jgi:hypothetical protein